MTGFQAIDQKLVILWLIWSGPAARVVGPFPGRASHPDRNGDDSTSGRARDPSPPGFPGGVLLSAGEQRKPHAVVQGLLPPQTSSRQMLRESLYSMWRLLSGPPILVPHETSSPSHNPPRAAAAIHRVLPVGCDGQPARRSAGGTAVECRIR